MQQLFLTDPLPRLRPAKDSSVALMQATRDAGSQVWWAEPRHLQALDGDIAVLAQPLELEPMHHDPQGWQVPDPWYRQGPVEQRSLTSFQLVWMRRDPPVDDAYTFAAGLLAQAERRGVRVVNRPASLLIWNEKLSALQFSQLMAPTIVSADCASLLAFVHQHREVVLKPLEGRGGQGVVRANSTMAGLTALLELVTAQQQLPVLAQAFLPDVVEGDKRILLVNGEPVGAINRRPQRGDFRSNLAMGGTPEACGLTARDHAICHALAEPLRQAGLAFVGIDVIGSWLSEINVTSPTGLREIEWLGGVPAADLVLQRLMEASAR
ncbi:MAG: glutathione synthetase [Candidatus Synechococcus spongiarum 142]|uniref:Glutathione synthetase n=1 Tax=Candidatus Synechococcus spongiarum 142 TaxID=1608213 RepID=A0A6N3X4C6_9SYNE|nr:MAG: glutathione synthetase [Candidatus Synechococcus spongiarum 142]